MAAAKARTVRVTGKVHGEAVSPKGIPIRKAPKMPLFLLGFTGKVVLKLNLKYSSIYKPMIMAMTATTYHRILLSGINPPKLDAAAPSTLKQRAMPRTKASDR